MAGPFYILQPKDADQVIFETVEDAVKWCADEANFWGWSRNSSAEEVGSSNRGRRDAFLQNIERAEAEYRNFAANRGNRNHLEYAEAALAKHGETGLVRTCPRAKHIDDLRKAFPANIAASSALATYLGEPITGISQPDETRYAALVGRTSIVQFDLGIVPKSVELLSETLTAMTSSQNDAMLRWR